jgi:hypothetical protein
MVQERLEAEVILRPAVSRPVRLGVRHSRGTRFQFFFLLEIFFRRLWVCYFLAPSLTRGRVCNLLLLLVLVSAVPLGSESRGTQDYTLLPQFLRLSQERGSPDIPPGIGFPFRRLLVLAGLLWRYSNPPPQGKGRTVLPTIIILCYNICNIIIINKKNQLRGLSPRANYTDRATATCWRS